jgi:hypothetical protein
LRPLSSPNTGRTQYNVLLLLVVVVVVVVVVVEDRLCGLVVRVPGYATEMYCASCEVRTEFIFVM